MSNTLRTVVVKLLHSPTSSGSFKVNTKRLYLSAIISGYAGANDQKGLARHTYRIRRSCTNFDHFLGQGEKINLKNCLKKFEKLIKKLIKKKIVKKV